MISVVSLDRLDRFKLPRSGGKQRKWITGRISADELKAVRAGVLCALGFASLTVYL